jgi:hypothetical protein
MIYILWIALFLILVQTGKMSNWDEESIMFMFKTVGLCAFVLPFWYGIQRCANELEKIRKLMDKAGGNNGKDT